MKKIFTLIILLLLLLNAQGQELLTNRYIAFGSNITDFVPQSDPVTTTAGKYNSIVTNGRAIYAVDSTNIYKFNVYFQLLSTVQIEQPGKYRAAHIDAFANCDTSITEYVLTHIHNNTNDTIKFRAYGTVIDTVVYENTAHSALGVYKTADTLFYVLPKKNSTGLISLVLRRFILDLTDTTFKLSRTEIPLEQAPVLFPYTSRDTTFDVAAISAKGDYMVMATQDTVFLISLDLQGQTASVAKAIDLDSVTGIAFAPAGGYIYFSLPGGIVQYDIASGKKGFVVSDTSYSSVVRSPNGHVFATASGAYDTYLTEIINPDLSLNNPDFAYKTEKLAGSTDVQMLYSSYEPWYDFTWERTDITQNTITFVAQNNKLPSVTNFRWYLNGDYRDDSQSITLYLSKDGDNKVYLSSTFSQCLKDYSFSEYHILRRLSDGFLGNDTVVCDTPFSVPLRIEYSNAQINWKYNYVAQPQWQNKGLLYATIPGIYSVEVILSDTTLFDTISIAYAACPMIDTMQILLNGVVLKEGEQNKFCTGYGSGSFSSKFVFDPDYHCGAVSIDWFLGGQKIGSGDGVFYQFTEPGIYTLFVSVYNNKRCIMTKEYSLSISVDPVDVTRSRRQITMMPNDKISISVGENDTSTFYLRSMMWRDNNVVSFANGNVIDLIDDGTVWSFSAQVSPLIDNPYIVSSEEVAVYAIMASDSLEYLNIQVTDPNGELLDYKRNYATGHTVMLGKTFYRLYQEPEEDDHHGLMMWQAGSNLTLGLVTGTYGYSTLRSKYVQRYSSMDKVFYDMATGLVLSTPDALDNLRYDNVAGEWKIDIWYGKNHYSNRMGSLKDIGLIIDPRFFRDTAEYEISWSSDPELTVDNLYNDLTNIRLYSSLPGSYTLTLTVSDNLGCSYKHGVDIFVLDRFYLNIPNAFTPNGDGINDTWDLSLAFASQLQGGQPVKVIIWNKKGKVVAKFDLQDNPQGWDGTYNGQQLPAGSYWYIVTLEDGKTFKGVVNLIR